MRFHPSFPCAQSTGRSSPYIKSELSLDVRASFDKVVNGVKYAVDYMRKHFNAEKLNNLPFTTLLVPLSVFFAVSGTKEASYTSEQSKKMNAWFWRAAFSKRYSSAVLRNLNTDIEQMRLLREGQINTLGDFPVEISSEYFLNNSFGLGNVNTKTFTLLLASCRPRSFVSGASVDLAKTLKEANRTEFHHLMPRAFLKKNGVTDGEEGVLANFAFLSRADNRLIGGVAPSAYKEKMPADPDLITQILEAALVPVTLFDDKFEAFVKERADLLATAAMQLCGPNAAQAKGAQVVT